MLSLGDRRLTPARSDVAAAHLRDQVEAARFTDGVQHQVVRDIADVRERPDAKSRLETQLLFGERFVVYDVADGWAWGQGEADSYVGYVDAAALSDAVTEPTHRVRALTTLNFPERDIKSAPHARVSFNAKLTVEATDRRFVKIQHGGWVFAAHLAPLTETEPDWVAAAERFVGAPYLWGGKSVLGVDCSGLIQIALESAGLSAPRDSDLQEAALGRPVINDDPRRGDLVFWPGHVGVMLDGEHLLHANAHHMETAIEPLAEAADRIRLSAGAITAIKRL